MKKDTKSYNKPKVGQNKNPKIKRLLEMTGIWKYRKEMKDSVAWVNKQREMSIRPHLIITPIDSKIK